MNVQAKIPLLERSEMQNLGFFEQRVASCALALQLRQLPKQRKERRTGSCRFRFVACEFLQMDSYLRSPHSDSSDLIVELCHDTTSSRTT
jgi:hypothetical protein